MGLPTEAGAAPFCLGVNPQPCLQDFAGKLGSLRKALKSRAELVFIDAPHLVDADESISEPFASEPRAWWTWQASSSVLRTGAAMSCQQASTAAGSSMWLEKQACMRLVVPTVCPVSWTSVTRILMWQAAPRWHQHILV